jgi:hypothetical protein
VTDEDADLHNLLLTLDPKAREDLRRVLIRDQADRDAISSRLMRYRDQNGRDSDNRARGARTRGKQGWGRRMGPARGRPGDEAALPFQGSERPAPIDCVPGGGIRTGDRE